MKSPTTCCWPRRTWRLSPLPLGEGPGVRAEQGSGTPDLQSSKAPNPRSPHPNPLPKGEGTKISAAKRHALTPAVEGLGDGLPMLNEPMRDFSQAGGSRAFHPGGRQDESARGHAQSRRRGSPEGDRRRGGRVSRLARPRSAGAIANAHQGGGADARPPRRAVGHHDPRGRQALARGRRRHLRGHRLLRVLRPIGRRPVPAAAAGAVRRRVEPPVASAARRGLGHQPVELPAGDLLRHDHRGAGRRQYGAW